jgi:hypothetical protein
MAALEKLKVEDPAAIDGATVAMGLSLGKGCRVSILTFTNRSMI